jgi:hypothetical protein
MVAARLRALLVLFGASLLLAGGSASAFNAWMTEEAMRQAFIGRTLDGHYASGLAWTETYADDGRLDYRERTRTAVGYWYFRGNVFCTFYDPPHRPALAGGCWLAIQTSANCYEFYLAGLEDKGPSEDETPELAMRWNARAWRQGEPSTCMEKPTV